MKKTLLIAVGVCAASGALAAPSVSDVLVRQQWPWRSSIRVDFLLDGRGTSDVKFAFTAYDGETRLGEIPDAAIVGDKFADRNGLKTVLIDPALVPALRDVGRLSAFRLTVSCTEVGEVLYKLIDLTKRRGDDGHIRYLTAADLKTNAYGLWAADFVPGVTSIAWPGVAADKTYCRDILVLRRIRPGTFGFGATAVPTTLTQGYWIGVFPVTGIQYDTVAQTADSTAANENLPKRRISPNALRGADLSWPRDGHRVASDSFFGKLAALVGEGGFDLPTEAQWEYACRSGTTDNAIYRSDRTLGEVAVFGASGCAEVGTKYPNAWGLYDMLGLAWEHVLTRFDAAGVTGGFDPVGPETSVCTARGGSFASGAANVSCVSRNGDATVEHTSLYHGFRVVQNENW